MSITLIEVWCSWCDRLLGYKLGVGRAGARGVARSHGMCPECEAKINAELEGEKWTASS